MANRYWVGGSGTWNTSSTTNWSASSGGASGASVPTAADSVFFDQATTYTVTCTGALTCLDITVSAGVVTFIDGTTPTFSISGSMSLVSGTVWSATGSITFNATTTGKTITTNGVTLPPVIISGVGGGWTLGSSLTIIGIFTFSNGSFDAATYDVTCNSFSASSSNIRTLSMGSGTWTLSGSGATQWNLATTTNLTFNKGTANIVLSSTTTVSRQFAGGGLTYNKLTIGGATGTSTLTFTGSNTFSEIASTKTVAHTIQFTAGTTTTVTNWFVTGTSGNVVTLQSSSAGSSYTLAKAGGGCLMGIDYLNVRDAIGSPISDTWYIGSNSTINTTAPNSGYAMFTTQRATNAVVVLTSTASATWDLPSDWNNASNTIHLIGGGGGGAGGFASGNNRAGGGGGGGAGYTKLLNQVLSSSITYQCGSAGSGGAASANGTSGGTTSWNSGASTAGGGGGGSATTTPSSVGGTAGSGSTYNGGVGGAGSTSTVASTGNAGGGGGGSGGFNGNGASGGIGFGSTTTANIAGGGGGGNGGGSAGGNASSGVGGTGGNNSSAVGGGASNTSGAVGGGGGGSTTAASVGGNGIDIFGIGSGGGGGGSEDTPTTTGTNTGGLYGSGGGGGGLTTAGTTRAGSNGAQGAIIIVYAPKKTGNFLAMF